MQTDSTCSMSCAANSSEVCGGGNLLTVYYANKPAPSGPIVNPGPPGWTSYGCVTDGGTRTLGNQVQVPGGASNMSVAGCTSVCSAGGYSLAGVEYAQECYCDNYLSAATKNATITDCNMPCNGNSSEFCGAGNRLNLYAAGTTVPTTKPVSAIPRTPLGWTSLGCYSDNVNGARGLTYGAAVPGGGANMTTENCISTCSANGYNIAGTEYSGECYCGNSFQNGMAPVTDGRCNMNCNGNSNEICGGPNGLSVYQFAGWYYLGCWVDGNPRTFSNGEGVTGDMTIEKCWAACQKNGYTLAGVEYAGECYCDNQPQQGRGPAPDGEAQCNMPCKGDTTEMCGGPNRLNVYQFNSSLSPVTQSSVTTTATAPGNNGGGNAPAPTTTASPTPSSSVNATAIAPFTYQGCYVDNGPGRALSQMAFDNKQNSVEACVAACAAQGYTIAGMEYSSQCFCDNYIHSSPALKADTDCNMACSGNPGEMCGAGNRLSIYSNGTMIPYQTPSFKTSGLPAGWNFQGCLSDSGNSRSLPYMMEYDNTNTNEGCMTLCQQFGYNAAGTEYGVQCFCGDVQNTIDAGATMLANSSCNIKCSNDTGNGGSWCGGGNALSYYTYTGQQMANWTFGTGNAAGAYQFLIGGVVIPLIVTPGRNGKVTFMEKFGTGPPNSTGAYELDLAQLGNFSAAWRPMHVKTDIFCSAGLTLPDRAGRQITVGGWSRPSTEGIRLYWPDGKPGVAGVNDWQENVDELALLTGRWYPSAMIMANGSVLVMGGEEGSNGSPVPNLEVLPSTGNLQYCDYLDRTDPYNLYPFLFVLPSGGIFVGYYNEARVLDPVSLQTTRVLPNMPGSVNRPDSGRTYPLEGTAVLLPQKAPYSDPLTVLVCGGSNPGAAVALDNCISIQPDNPSSNWTLERMPSKRVMPNMCALPDGTYLIANGAHQGTAGFGLATDPNLNAVLYDPTKPLGSRMTVMANTTVARLYHSELVMLDDGRVLVSGSDPEDGTNPQEYRNEVFIPPYLMGGAPRPTLSLSNLDWAYGQSISFSFTPSGSGSVSNYRVSLLGAVSSTHGNSMGQRTFFPATSCSGTSCTVVAPPNANICPPGWFQVFLLDGNNIPSNATWVRVGGDPGSIGNWPNLPGFDLPGTGPVQALF